MVRKIDMAHIGFVGVGNMGGGMAANLVKAGHVVTVFDLSEEALAAAVAAGCVRSGSVGDCIDGSDALVTMLPAGAHVRTVYEKEVFKWAKPGMLLLDCSTIDVKTARDIGAQAAARNLLMVDAPVSGGVAAANAGTLTFMVGGSRAAFEKAESLLSNMGKAVIHAGEAGAGQAAKICNNMLLAITMIGTCEAFTLAQKLELDPKIFYDISSKASGQSWSMTSYCPVAGPVPAAPSNRDFEGGFASALMLKDLKLAMDAAQAAGAAVPLGAQSEALYQMFAGLGGAAKDFSAIIKMVDGSWRG
jgi:3-hydroxyisobutyrate dehydrogenase